MWTLSLLVTLFVFHFITNFVGAEIEEILKADFFSIYTKTALSARDITNEPVTKDKVKYYMFLPNDPENYIDMDMHPVPPQQLNQTNATIIFLIHGWTENRKQQWYEDLKNAFFTKLGQQYFVIQVDWSDPANQIYTVSSYNTREVGTYVAEYIVNLHEKFSIPLNNFLVVGHSLGGQVAGFVGKKIKELAGKKLPRIVALDPAGPLFISRPEEERLNRNDAEVVAVIHTDGGTFGFKPSCGTIDFYPNGGSGQPGCKRIDLLDIKSVGEPITCDHHRSWDYFIEAVLNPSDFLSVRCESWDKFEDRKCEGQKVAMGNLDTTATGEFYLETNKDKPYAKKSSDGMGFGLSQLLKF